ncbi:MAG: hypothetical protein AAGH64_10985, partial [Planctomycetota bacterium]
VTYGSDDLFEAQRENNVLSNTFDPIFGFRGYHSLVLQLEGIDHYLMLCQLAEDMGFYNPAGVADEILVRLYRQFAGQFPNEDQLARVQQTYQEAIVTAQDPEVAERALRRLDSIFRMRLMYQAATALSEPELSLYSTRLFNGVEADVGYVPGVAYAEAELGPFTEDDFVAQYERFRDDFPEDNAFGFSYRLEDAARFELLLVDRQVISNAIELDPIELRKHHLVNKEERGWNNDFGIARVTVERDLRDQKVDEVLGAIENSVNNALVNATSQLPRDDSGRRVLPDDWEEQRPGFESLAEAANAASDALIVTDEPVARVLRYTDRWYTREDIRTATELSGLGLMVQGRRASLSNAMMLFPAFEPENALPEAQLGLTLAGVTDAPTGLRGGLGYLRLLEARKEGPSTSIEEVRERVERDTKALRGYESLASRLDEIRSDALAGDLAQHAFSIVDPGALVSVGAQIKYFDIQFMQPSPVFFTDSVGRPELSGALNNEGFARRVVERTTGFDPTLQTDAISDELRFFVLALPEAQGIALVHVTEHRPIALEELQRVSGQASTYLAQRVREENADDPIRPSLSKASIAGRYGFVAFDSDYALETDEGDDPASGDSE